MTVVNVKRGESDECLEAQKADAVPHDHPRVHCYAGSRKYYGDLTAPSKSRVWATIQSPEHTAHKPSPAQIYLCNAREPPITCKELCRLYGVLPRGQNGKAFPKQGLFAGFPAARRASRAAAPRPLPADNGAVRKGYRKKKHEKHKLARDLCCTWEVHPVHKHNFFLPTWLTRKTCNEMTIAVISLLQALLYFHMKAAPT